MLKNIGIMIKCGGMGKMIVSVNADEDLRLLKEAGADAVLYAVRGMSFSALKPIFVSETAGLISGAHEAGLEIHLNVNALFHQDEAEEVKAFLSSAAEKGTDGFFFSDMSLMRAAVQGGFEGRMIYHPMTLLTNSYDAGWWMGQGLQSAVISPVLTSQEITQMIRKVSGLIVQIHGRSLMSVSARSLLGAYEEVAGCIPLKEKNGLFLTEEKRDGRMPVYENERGTMVFTDFIQESFREILSFEQAGSCRYLIEGTGMGKEELRDTLKTYSEILNGADPAAAEMRYRETYSALPLSEGYYEQETIK